MSNSEHTVQDIRDILQSYYKVARKRFVDNVCMQASDHHLVTGPEAPMKLFSATWVNALSDDRLEDIAGEEMASRLRRQRLRKEIKDLEAGRSFSESQSFQLRRGSGCLTRRLRLISVSIGV